MDADEKKNPDESICGSLESKDDVTSIADEESCGFEIGCGKCRTKRYTFGILNCFNNAKAILFFLCIAVLIQGMAVNGLINIVISTLEKRFHLKSSETGFVAGCYDLGFLLAVTVVTYVGGRGHKPLWIGWGVLVMGLGSITFSLPHFIAPAYSVSNVQSFLCDDNMTLTECGESHLRVYRGFFILGHLLHGMGASGLFTLAITYMDANVKESASSIYHGIFFAFSVAGPGIGFLLGGYFIQFYTNLGEKVTIDESSPYWVGNWWLGYIITGSSAIVVSIPLLMYPKQLPHTSEYRRDREQEMNQNPDAIRAKQDLNFGKSIKDVPRALLVVIRNVTLVLLSIAGAMDSGTVIALATFGPKYTEAMFRLPASTAGIYFGIASIVSSCTAHMIGGCIISKLKLRVKTMLQFCIVCAALAFGCLFIFLIQCENPKVPGVNEKHTGESTLSCENSCGCVTKLYDPVCGADGLTYLSSCDAGCTSKSGSEYSNCTEINVDGHNSTASSGKCEVASCPSVGVLLSFGALVVFFTFLKFQPALQVSLRTVPFHQRSFAVGMQWVIMRCFGLIPLPLILGSLLDSSCLVWGDVCGECGSCKLYDNASMAKFMTTLFTVTKGVSILSLVAALVTYKPPPVDESELRMNSNSVYSDGTVATNGNGVQVKSLRPLEPTPYDNKAFS